MRRFVPLFFAVGIVGCTQDKTAAPDASAETKTEAAPEEKVPLEEEAFVTGTTSLKKVASDDKKIDDPAGSGKRVSNWLATLYRGEQVVMTSAEGDWAKVRTTDEKEGWLRKNKLLSSAEVTLATSFDTAKVFKRPDLLALDSTKSIEPGNLLFIIKDKEQFTEVNYPRSEWSGSNVWMLSEKLTKDSSEVSAAKLVMKVRYLRAKNDSSAKQVEALARETFGGSQLIKLLDQAPEPEAEPEAAEEAPAAAP